MLSFYEGQKKCRFCPVDPPPVEARPRFSGQEAAFALSRTPAIGVHVESKQAAAAWSDQHSDIEAAVTWLAGHYLMSDSHARILLGQAAHQDGRTELETARRLIDDLQIQAHRSRV